MARLNTEKVDIFFTINAENAGNTLKGLRGDIAKLKAELDKAEIGTDEYVKKLEELRKKEDSYRVLRRGVTDLADAQKHATMGARLFGGALDALKTSMLPLLAFGTVVELMRQSISGFNDSAKASAELTRALDGNTEAVDRLKTQSEQLQNTSLFDDNTITQAQATLALYADTADQIEALTPLVLDYAAATGQELGQAAETIGVALTQEAGALEDLGVSFDQSASKADRLAIIQGVLADKVGGAAKTAAAAGTGPLQQLGNKFNDILEKLAPLILKIANAFIPILDAVIPVLEPVINYMSWWIDTLTLAATKIGEMGNALVNFFSPGRAAAQEADKLREQQVQSEQKAAAEKLKIEAEATKAREAERMAREKAEEEARKKREAAAEKERERQKALREKQAQDERAALENIRRLELESMEEGLAKKLAQLDEAYRKEIAAIVGNEEQKSIQEALLFEKYADLKAEAEKADQDRREKLEAEHTARLVEARRTAREQELAEQQAWAAQEKAYEAEQQRIREEEEKQKQELAQRTADARTSAQQQANQGLEDGLQLLQDVLSKDEAARKKNAQAIKAVSVARIGMQLAEEVQAIWRNAQANPVNILFPGFANLFAAVQTGFAIGRAALQTSNVMKQKFALGGILPGRTHGQGGNPVLDGATGQVIAEVEAGEVILSRSTVRNNPGVVGALLDASMHGGGRPIFETGGVFPNIPSTSNGGGMANVNALVNEIRMLRAAIPQKLQAQVSFNDIETADRLKMQMQQDSRL